MEEKILYQTDLGKYLIGDSEILLKNNLYKLLKGKVQLILTSPPFPLNNKKKYGNLQGEDYKKWFIDLAEIFSELLTDNGSIVLELGNSWEPQNPIQSLLPLESLLGFVKNDKAGLKLIQEFICYNPARLPSPVQYVNIERSRVTDSFSRVWWMSKTIKPKADNRKILRPYSESMNNLLKNKSYNSGKRPSEHVIGKDSFLKNNGGSIIHNVLDLSDDNRLPFVFKLANTNSNDFYLKSCRENNLTPHPARMPIGLANTFIEFLTDENDLVLDPFAGSNTTGFSAELSKRKWLVIDAQEEYGLQSIYRFKDPSLTINLNQEINYGFHFGY